MSQLRRIKHYEILSPLGEGGMGVVYRARDTRLGRQVALKLLPEKLASSEERVARFEREARIISNLTHPGIATLYEFDRTEDNTAFLAMELVEGPTLRRLIADGPMPPEAWLDCAIQLAEALAAAHREGVIHRDLKPENIMRADSGYYKILDFGVARVEELSQSTGGGTKTPTRTLATRAGQLIGTIAYMSPEQLLGEPVDARSDLFSLGSVLHELATGHPPFQGNNDITLAHAIAYGDHAALERARESLPPAIRAVLARCQARDRDDRYASATELVRDLRALRSTSLSGETVRESLLAHRPATRGKRHGMLWGALAASLALVGAFAGWYALHSEAPTRGSSSGVLPSAIPVQAVPRPAPPTGRPRVVVAYFENLSGDPETDWLTRGLPEMLTTDLAQDGGIEVIATQRLRDLLRMSGANEDVSVDRTTAAELARWAGATVVVSGSLVRIGDRYRIDAQAYDTADGTVRLARKVEGSDLVAMVGELTEALRQGLAPRNEIAPPPTLVASKAAEPAYRSFVQGREAFDKLDLDSAARHFDTSLEIDPDFNLARLKLAETRILQGRAEETRALLQEVADQAGTLPPLQRSLAEALQAFYVDGDVDKGNLLLEELTLRYPEDQELWLWWGRALAARDLSPLEAMRKLRRAIEIDPSSLQANAALARELSDLGARDDAQQMLGEVLARHPDAADAIARLLNDEKPPAGNAGGSRN